MTGKNKIIEGKWYTPNKPTTKQFCYISKYHNLCSSFKFYIQLFINFMFVDETNI